MSVQRISRWPNIKLTLVQCELFLSLTICIWIQGSYRKWLNLTHFEPIYGKILPRPLSEPNHPPPHDHCVINICRRQVETSEFPKWVKFHHFLLNCSFKWTIVSTIIVSTGNNQIIPRPPSEPNHPPPMIIAWSRSAEGKSKFRKFQNE